ncbi:hypothetical protein [Streptomyces scopuliridis]|uniref:hypothetical protein n=1 Tax=Streptomyces scopuliridis TaxID=452529 RepID=UPI001057F6AD|nr:hypothetical protein [Streptomyces scopuliridis]
MKPKYKGIVLISGALLAMAALIYVNLQNVRDTGRRGVSSASEGRTPEDGHRSSALNRIARVEF